MSLIAGPSLPAAALERAAADLATGPFTTTRRLYADDTFALFMTAHDGYPYWYAEEPDYVLACEGAVYNRDIAAWRSECSLIARRFASGDDVGRDVERFAGEADGDFVMAVYARRTGRLLVFNDRLGRLPCVMSGQGGRFVLTREGRFALHCAVSLNIDRLGVAQFLAFEYTLGGRGLFEGMLTLRPGGMVMATVSGDGPAEVRTRAAVPLVFERGGDALPPERSVEQARDLFIDSVRARTETVDALGLQLIADVSGGFDTRTVMGGLERVGAEAAYYTHDLVTGDESAVAGRLAAIYGRELRHVRASHDIDYGELADLVYRTDCRVNGWTALTGWRDGVEKRGMTGGPAATFMGFGGEFIRHPFVPVPGFPDIGSMMRGNVLKTRIDPRWAGELAGIGRDGLVEAVAEHVGAYPERTRDGALRRFYYEYYNTLVNGGEDRLRNIFWTVQPLWGTELYLHETGIPLDDVGYAYYTRFMELVDSRLLDVPIHGSDVRPDSPVALRRYDRRQHLRAAARARVRSNRLLDGIRHALGARSRRTAGFRGLASLVREARDGLVILDDVIPGEAVEGYLGWENDPVNLHRLLSMLVYLRAVEERFGDLLLR